MFLEICNIIAVYWNIIVSIILLGFLIMMYKKCTIKLHFKDKDSYLELIEELPLASISSDEHLDVVLKMIDRLMVNPLDEGSQLYSNAWLDIIEIYEDAHHKIGPPSESAMLQHLMEANQVTQEQVSDGADVNIFTIIRVLHSNMKLKHSDMSKLAKFFKVDVNLFTGYSENSGEKDGE